jgi:hypothetical protein
MADGVHKITIQTRAPKGRDPGAVEIGYYCVADQHVVLTDKQGKPISGAPKWYVGPDGNAKLLACVLLREHRSGTARRKSGFSGPIQYPKSGWC